VSVFEQFDLFLVAIFENTTLNIMLVDVDLLDACQTGGTVFVNVDCSFLLLNKFIVVLLGKFYFLVAFPALPLGIIDFDKFLKFFFYHFSEKVASVLVQILEKRTYWFGASFVFSLTLTIFFGTLTRSRRLHKAQDAGCLLGRLD